MKIQSTKTLKDKPIYSMYYGVSGIGKTSLSKTIPGRILILDAESGLASLKNQEGNSIDFISLNNNDEGQHITEGKRFDRLKEFMAFVQLPETKAAYDVLFVDSLTEISQTVQKHMKEIHGADGFKVWGEYTAAMVDFIKFFRDLDHYHVVFTALEERIDPEEGTAFFFPAIGGKKIKEYLMPCFDEVYRMIVDENKARLFVTQPTAKTQAKNRLGGLAEIEKANVGDVWKKIRGENK